MLSATQIDLPLHLCLSFNLQVRESWKFPSYLEGRLQIPVPQNRTHKQAIKLLLNYVTGSSILEIQKSFPTVTQVSAGVYLQNKQEGCNFSFLQIKLKQAVKLSLNYVTYVAGSSITKLQQSFPQSHRSVQFLQNTLF